MSLDELVTAARTFADLFAGIGGFHHAAAERGWSCEYAVERDTHAANNYKINHGLLPFGDIRALDAATLPPVDVICAGFPCQPFSSNNARRIGTRDPRGQLFWDIMRIADAHRPRPALALENVPALLQTQGGEAWRQISAALHSRGYTVAHKILDARDLGLPQARRRLLIAATQKRFDSFPWPKDKIPMRPVEEIIDPHGAHPKHHVNLFGMRRAINMSRARIRGAAAPAPCFWSWSYNSDNVTVAKYALTLRRQGAFFYWQIDDGKRRRNLTAREKLRLQGFPDTHLITASDRQTHAQAGNAIPVPMAGALIDGISAVLDG